MHKPQETNKVLEFDGMQLDLEKLKNLFRQLENQMDSEETNEESDYDNQSQDQ